MLLTNLTKIALIGYLTLETLSKYAQIISRIQTFSSIIETLYSFAKHKSK